MTTPDVQEGVRRLSNGALQDTETGKIVQGPQMTSEQARRLAERRWEQVEHQQRLAFIRALGIEVDETNLDAVNTAYAKARGIVEEELVHGIRDSEERIKNRVDSYVKLTKQQDRQRQADVPDGEGLKFTLELSPEVASSMAETMLKAKQKAESSHGVRGQS